MSTTTWVWVSLHYATFALELRDGRVVKAPPIAYWATGKTTEHVLSYFERKGARLEQLNP